MRGEMLLLPCETQAREFDAKLLLAAAAAERGITAIVGAKKELDRCLGSFRRGTYLSKSLTDRNLVTYELLRRQGFAVVCGDEEGLVWPSPASYLHAKVNDETMRKADLLLAWGEENARVWRESPGFCGQPIASVGNARVDLLRPELRGLHQPTAQALRKRFGRFVLVNTNFSRLNHYLPRQNRQQRKLDEARRAAGPVDPNDLDLGLAAHKAELFAAFKRMLPALADALPDHRIVVRPHPSERQATWTEAVAGRPNVQVVYEGSVVPWLLAAEAVVHNGCTTAVEAYLLDAQAIAYQPATSERFDLQLPNLMSKRTFDQESLIEAVRARVAGGPVVDPNEHAKQEELIDQYVASRRGALAVDRILDALAEFETGSRVHQRVDALPALGARTVVAGRRIMRLVEARIPGHHNSRPYLRHMFPGATRSQVESRIAAYGSALGRFSGLRVRERFENVFEVGPAVGSGAGA